MNQTYKILKNLKQFSLCSSPDTLQYTSKKEDPVITKINYTFSDLEAFDRIVESKEDSTNNQTHQRMLMK